MAYHVVQFYYISLQGTNIKDRIIEVRIMEVQFYYISIQGTNIKDRIIEVRIMEVQFYYIITLHNI